MAVVTQPSQGVFHQALELLGDQRVMQFGSFDEYKKQADFPGTDTATAISVQTLATLNPELRARKVMVFRCGSERRFTRFALARGDCWPDDYFIRDEGFDAEPKTFRSAAPTRELFSFRLIKPVERTLVNLALTTGALATALDLDDHDYGPPGATGSSPYSFKFQPHSSDSTVLSHDSGQVEIDLLFVAKRGGEEVAFVVEAKQDEARYRSDHPRSSLAKHKLLFPVLAIRPQVPPGMQIVPVYLKATVGEDNIDFHIAECGPFDGGDQAVACVDTMSVVRRESLRLPNQFAKGT